MAAKSNRLLRRYSIIMALDLMTAFSSLVRAVRLACSGARRAG